MSRDFAADLEPFRESLGLLGRLQLDDQLAGKVDVSRCGILSLPVVATCLVTRTIRWPFPLTLIDDRVCPREARRKHLRTSCLNIA